MAFNDCEYGKAARQGQCQHSGTHTFEHRERPAFRRKTCAYHAKIFQRAVMVLADQRLVEVLRRWDYGEMGDIGLEGDGVVGQVTGL